VCLINPLDFKGNYDTKLVHWPLMGGLLTITVLLYDGALLCGFNVGIKGSV